MNSLFTPYSMNSVPPPAHPTPPKGGSGKPLPAFWGGREVGFVQSGVGWGGRGTLFIE